jgi:hypothetical protein
MHSFLQRRESSSFDKNQLCLDEYAKARRKIRLLTISAEEARTDEAVFGEVLEEDWEGWVDKRYLSQMRGVDYWSWVRGRQHHGDVREMNNVSINQFVN